MSEQEKSMIEEEDKEGINVRSCYLEDYLNKLRQDLRELVGLTPKTGNKTIDEAKATSALRPLFAYGPPAIGKTGGTREVVEEIRVELKERGSDIYFGFCELKLSTLAVGTLQGLQVPVGNEIRTIYPNELPVIGERDRDDGIIGEYGVLFLDEFTSARLEQTTPAFGLLDGTRGIGAYKLPKHWKVVVAGNTINDANYVHLSSAILSRCTTFNVVPHFPTWATWAREHNIYPDILSFLRFKPEHFYLPIENKDIHEGGKEFAAPRTWESLSDELYTSEAEKIIKGVKPDSTGKYLTVQEVGKLADSHIGTKSDAAFVAFLTVVNDCDIDPKDIIEGKVKESNANLKHEQILGIYERMLALVKEEIEDEEDIANLPENVIQHMVNMVNWVLNGKTLDYKFTFFAIMKKEVHEISEAIRLNDSFEKLCPEFDNFISDYSTQICDEFVRFAENM